MRPCPINSARNRGDKGKGREINRKGSAQQEERGRSSGCNLLLLGRRRGEGRGVGVGGTVLMLLRLF